MPRLAPYAAPERLLTIVQNDSAIRCYASAPDGSWFEWSCALNGDDSRYSLGEESRNSAVKWDGAVYAILPRRPIGDIVLNDVESAGKVQVTLLEGGQPLESTLQGKQLRVRVPPTLAGLPARQAYVLKLAGAR